MCERDDRDERPATARHLMLDTRSRASRAISAIRPRRLPVIYRTLEGIGPPIGGGASRSRAASRRRWPRMRKSSPRLAPSHLDQLRIPGLFRANSRPCRGCRWRPRLADDPTLCAEACRVITARQQLTPASSRRLGRRRHCGRRHAGKRAPCRDLSRQWRELDRDAVERETIRRRRALLARHKVEASVLEMHHLPPYTGPVRALGVPVFGRARPASRLLCGAGTNARDGR